MPSHTKHALNLENLESRRLLAGDLRITEVNFNPHPSMVQFGEREADPDDYEFVELANVGDAPLQLDDYEFTQGIDFKFKSQLIQPGERLLVVQDPREFTIRYGSAPKFARGDGGGNSSPGEFSGSLKNSGESIVLAGPSGAIVQQFSYYDSGEWPRRSDGGGSTLEVIDPPWRFKRPEELASQRRIRGQPR